MEEAEQHKRKMLISRMKSLGQAVSTETAIFHHVAACSYGLGVTDIRLVSSILQEGPMTAGQAATRLSLTTGAVTNVIDRLEQRGVVHRITDKQDKRKVIVAANKQFFKGKKNVYTSMGIAFENLLQNYSTSELEFLARHLENTIEITRQETSNLQIKCNQQ